MWVALLVLGPYLGMVWAGNIMIFLVWLNFVGMLGWNCIEKHAPEKVPEIKEKYEGVPKGFHNFNMLFDIGLAAALCGAGWFWMGGILALSALGESGAKDKLLK
jgi:hypothetical protein